MQDNDSSVCTPGEPDAAAACRGVRRRIAERVVLALGAVVLLVVGWLLEDGLPPTDVALVLAVLAGGCGAAAALLAVFAARLTADQQAGWVSMALGCYGLLVIPTSTIAALDPAPATVAVRVLADGVVTGLILIAAVAPWQLSGRLVRLVLLGSAVAVAAAAVLGIVFPAAVSSMATFVPVLLVLALVWTAAGVRIAVQAARRQATGLAVVGAGTALLGGAHVLRIDVVGWPGVDDAAAVSGLRLVAVALVLYGTLRLARLALARHDTLEEELRLAETRLARTAERDHELRNGLAGLAGATTLLGGGCSDPARLGTVVSSELGRLDDLLQAPVDDASEDPSTSYAVAPVLHGLITLRSSAGMDIDQELEPGLRALGSSATLAQVVTNLLANAERHAPGTSVRVTAQRRDDRVVVRVIDSGPGLSPGTEESVFVPGVCDQARGGLGLGLHVCRRLLAAENGSITLHTSGSGDPGCVVVVELPAAPPTVWVRRPATPARLDRAS